MLSEGTCSSALRDAHKWGVTTVDHSRLTDSDLTLMRSVVPPLIEKEGLNGQYGRDLQDIKRLRTQLGNLKKIAKASTSTNIKNLEVMTEALIQVITKTPRRWLFIASREGGSDIYIPWLVVSIHYEPARKHSDGYFPASIRMELRGFARGHSVSHSFTWNRTDLGVGGCGPLELLSNENALVADEELLADYEKNKERYLAIRLEDHVQYWASGSGAGSDDEDGHSRRSRWWDAGSIRVGDGDAPGRIILDDNHSYGTDSAIIDEPKQFASSEEDQHENEDELQQTHLPVHPLVRCFSLLRHEYCVLHIGQLERYEYDDKLYDKLILPRGVKQLIEVLVLSSTRGLDLIRSKGAGTIIMASGPPGVGKTLTAEVFAERAKMPLYPVQCAQLGTDPEELEKNLGRILINANRWGAILLLDEADVYIRQRGDDLTQNAVVGVFLRLLEYYQGVLFLTTNREDVVDDAIVSRCIARFRYEIPGVEERQALWELYADKSGLELHSEFISETLAPVVLSGRTIRGLCRLMKTTQACGAELNEDLFQWLLHFQHGAPTLSARVPDSPLPDSFTITTPRKRPKRV